MVCRPTVMLCVQRGGVSCVSDRAQLGRLGGSRWGWLLQIKFPCHDDVYYYIGERLKLEGETKIRAFERRRGKA